MLATAESQRGIPVRAKNLLFDGGVKYVTGRRESRQPKDGIYKKNKGIYWRFETVKHENLKHREATAAATFAQQPRPNNFSESGEGILPRISHACATRHWILAHPSVHHVVPAVIEVSIALVHLPIMFSSSFTSFSASQVDCIWRQS